MHTTVPPLDPETFAAFRAGNETAFERLFRDTYPNLVVAASSELGDPPRAARAVERAVVSAWRDRTGIPTPQALEAYIDRALNEEIVHEKGRIASVHRFESFEKVHAHARTIPAPTVDEAWTKVATTLHPLPPAAQLRHEEAKHHAAAHLAAVARRKSPASAVIVVIALAAVALAGFLFLPDIRGEGALTRALASPQTRSVTSQPGQRGSVRLDDGSTLTLGGDSRLTIPSGFPNRVRGVKLEGTASFTVAKGVKRPFIVRAGNATITATGTAFDVSAFSADTTTIVAVRDGQVQLRTARAKRTLRSGESAAVDKSGGIAVPTPTRLEEAFSWVGGQLTIVDRPLRDVLPVLRRWYALDLIPVDSSMLSRHLSLRAGLDSRDDVIRALQTNAAMIVEYEGKRTMLRDIAPAGKRP